MRIVAFLWDDENVSHIARHGVSPEEAEETLGREPTVRKSRFGRYVAVGPTEAGRFLLVVFRQLGSGVVRIITARDATVKERRAYGRK
jgi:uncharacterized DUF497 family protein